MLMAIGIKCRNVNEHWLENRKEMKVDIKF